MENIIEGNKLIAEFMGGIVRDDLTCQYYSKLSIPYWAFGLHNFDTLKIGGYEYYSSWDWLMPVVEKIEEIGKERGFTYGDYYVTIEANSCRIHRLNEQSVAKGFGKTKIEGTWKSIIQFIQWHNTLTPENK